MLCNHSVYFLKDWMILWLVSESYACSYTKPYKSTHSCESNRVFHPSSSIIDLVFACIPEFLGFLWHPSECDYYVTCVTVAEMVWHICKCRVQHGALPIRQLQSLHQWVICLRAWIIFIMTHFMYNCRVLRVLLHQALQTHPLLWVKQSIPSQFK